MKLTSKDKKLLILLAIVIFSVLFSKFVILPKLSNITALKTDIASLNNTYTMNLAFKSKTESLDSDIKILAKKLEDLRAIYPPSINSDELLVIMKELINKSKLEVKSLAFERAKPVSLEDKEPSNAPQQTEADKSIPKGADISGIMNYFYLWGLLSQQDEKSTEPVVIPDGKGYAVNVKIDAQGTNRQIKEFLSSLEKLNNRAYCKTSSIIEQQNVQVDDEKRILRFTADIEFYGIMDKGAGEYYLLDDGKWMPIAASNKDNIFKPYPGYESTSASFNSGEVKDDTTQSENSSKASELGEYDFSVVASAFGGGLAPSVQISCRNPVLSQVYANPVVYGDNKGFENAEIFIEKKAGKYYCKIRTDHETYPDKQYKETFEFEPMGKALKILILSSERSDEDNAGVSLNIINNTDKTVIYEILYDDEKLPRVKIAKTVGSVQVQK